MTENEKLRALLAEARAYTTDVQNNPARDLRRRIDAALAEPVTSNCLQCWALNELRVSDQRKNDETRIELRDVYWELHMARAELSNAYRRGAEAMKLAALAVCDDEALFHRKRGRATDEVRAFGASLAAARIEALSIPEDK